MAPGRVAVGLRGGPRTDGSTTGAGQRWTGRPWSSPARQWYQVETGMPEPGAEAADRDAVLAPYLLEVGERG